jgi:thioredoxin-like negative regulator of GroEL
MSRLLTSAGLACVAALLQCNEGLVTVGFTLGSHRQVNSQSRPSLLPSIPCYQQQQRVTTSQLLFSDFDDYQSDASSAVPFTSPVRTFASTLEFLDAVEDADANDLVVVLFHAHYCKVCQRSNVQYRKVAYRYDSHVQFCRLETSHFSAEHLQSLGVERFPFVQIYRNKVCVASFAPKDQVEACLTEAIHACQTRSLTDWQALFDRYASEMANNKRARQALRVEPVLQGPLVTLTEYKALDRILEADKLTVVLYHSHFVEACHRAQQQIRTIQDYYKKESIQFARIEIGALSDEQMKEKKIVSTPFVEVYRRRELVESFATGPSYMFKRKVYGAIDKYIAPMRSNQTAVDTQI